MVDVDFMEWGDGNRPPGSLRNIAGSFRGRSGRPHRRPHAAGNLAGSSREPRVVAADPPDASGDFAEVSGYLRDEDGDSLEGLGPPLKRPAARRKFPGTFKVLPRTLFPWDD